MDLICYSHLRWNFVYQRPQHLLTRFTKKFRVFYIEEPIYITEHESYLDIKNIEPRLWILVPRIQESLSGEERLQVQQQILDQFYVEEQVEDFLLWYYTPMALLVSRHLKPALTVYDCMDELSAFKFAPTALKELENELLKKADIVFTGGYSLYQAKKDSHHNIHPFPSSIDKDHFNKARTNLEVPEDQAFITKPRFGFYGVIDERFDLGLIAEVAARKPGWNFILIGPVVKIDEHNLPRLSNIHYPGSKTYQQLPAYLSGWDVAIIPFVLNESTRYISPTKTPEYLAGGKPVISTAIADVIDPYGLKNIVNIIQNADEFIEAGEKELNVQDKSKWMSDVDLLLSGISWDKTWLEMMNLLEKTLSGNKNLLTNLNEEVYV